MKLATLLAALAAAGYAQTARQVFEKNCLGCHGAARMSELDLRERATILRGGRRGPAIVPGNAAASRLYKAVLRDGELQMPPGKDALPKAETEALRAWIDNGAPWDAAPLTTEPSWWSFRKAVRAPVPEVREAIWVRTPIDALILRKLEEKGLRPARAADKRVLIRRAYFDLHGLPPSPAEVEQFVNDSAPDAYEKLIDRLLASPRYGERWGRHWLDVVRYADTGGFETDVYFANAWRYRDYVIQSFNDDKPYNVFVEEQIAADEIWPDNLELEGAYELPRSKQTNLSRRIGTGLYTIGPMAAEYTFFGDQFRAEWQADAVETTASAFLGLSMGCARCHDHKFDPISQRDYYRFAALFAGSEDREIPIVSQMGIYEYTRYQTRLVTADQLKAKLQRLEAEARKRRGAAGGETNTRRAGEPSYTPSERDERESLLRQIGDAYVKAPVPYARANVLAHSERVPDTHILLRGDFKQKGEKVTPGFPGALPAGPEIVEPAGALFVPQRRKALAEWITSFGQPLLARVMVNRIWQGHFGRGIVATPNDFGRQGETPSHPELLDWLAIEFAERGWSMKAMHRLVMLSSTYRMSSESNPDALRVDPDNRLVWRMNRRRLEAEALRDAVLAASSTLNLKMGGPPIALPLTEEERAGMRDFSQWPVAGDPADHARRSAYLYVKRSFRLPMLEAFDAPDATASCPRRESSTVAPQALTLMNSNFMTAQAGRFAARLKREHGEKPEAWVNAGWQIAFGRTPAAAERDKALDFLQHNSLPRLCLLWLNMSEFLYVD
ncbi:MAG: PSD1 and planctomycete cytochrome C domain-containing protein [Bryobacteraceae bacterium]